MDCIFCKIAAGEIPARIAFENERLVAFHDLFPQAPTHLLIIPKQHYATLNDVPASDSAVLGEMVSTATQLARELGVADSGYRVVMNCNPDGGQSVYHIHLHLLAGRQLGWPPG
ncbi:MAG: histidine triad nucleotide-binding protein [Gammaproteobacteria bacterium]